MSDILLYGGCGGVLIAVLKLVAVRGLARSLQDNFGFEPQNTMLADTDLSMAGYSGDRVPPMQKRMIDAIETFAGVESLGLADQVPLGDTAPDSNVFTDTIPQI